jgi:hypothetical protein
MQQEAQEHGMDLYDMAKAVRTRDDFLNFVHSLAGDYIDDRKKARANPVRYADKGPNGWANGDIDTFLDAMIAWADAVPERVGEEPSWNTFALLLLAGKEYE